MVCSWGCGSCGGDPTSAPFGWRCLGEVNGTAPMPAASYHEAVAQGGAPAAGCYALPLHQTAAYDLVSTLLLFLVLLFLGRTSRRPGFLALVFTTWYAGVRLPTDFLREDKRYWGLTGSQITALVVLLVSPYLLTRTEEPQISGETRTVLRSEPDLSHLRDRLFFT